MNDNKEHPQLLPFHKSNDRTSAEDLDEQDDLKQLLRKLRLDDPSEELDNRILSSYSRQIERRSIWKQVLLGNISIPIPVAAMIALLIIPLAYFAFRPSATVMMQTPKFPSEKVRVVEVPTVQERIITRTVYVNRLTNQDGAPGKSSSEKRKTVAESGFDEFTPVDELKIRLIKGSGQYEK